MAGNHFDLVERIQKVEEKLAQEEFQPLYPEDRGGLFVNLGPLRREIQTIRSQYFAQEKQLKELQNENRELKLKVEDNHALIERISEGLYKRMGEYEDSFSERLKRGIRALSAQQREIEDAKTFVEAAEEAEVGVIRLPDGAITPPDFGSSAIYTNEEEYKRLKAEINDIELLDKVEKRHCLMEWEVARYMELTGTDLRKPREDVENKAPEWKDRPSMAVRVDKPPPKDEEKEKKIKNLKFENRPTAVVRVDEPLPDVEETKEDKNDE